MSSLPPYVRRAGTLIVGGFPLAIGEFDNGQPFVNATDAQTFLDYFWTDDQRNHFAFSASALRRYISPDGNECRALLLPEFLAACRRLADPEFYRAAAPASSSPARRATTRHHRAHLESVTATRARAVLDTIGDMTIPELLRAVTQPLPSVPAAPRKKKSALRRFLETF